MAPPIEFSQYDLILAHMRKFIGVSDLGGSKFRSERIRLPLLIVQSVYKELVFGI